MPQSTERKLKDGKYMLVFDKYEQSGGNIVLSVRESEKSIILHLLENTCRYAPAHIENMFSKSKKVIIRKKDAPPHAIVRSDSADDWFVIYPYRAGEPFLFEWVDNL